MKKIVLGLIALSSISASAIELHYPTWNSSNDLPFKAYRYERKNKIEADKICLIHTNRELKSKSFEVEQLEKHDLEQNFPGAVSIVHPASGKSFETATLMSRILVNQKSWAVPDNAHRAVLEPLVEISNVDTTTKVRIFKSIICE